MDGFKRVYSGEWLTVYTGDKCLIDYQRKELLLDQELKLRHLKLGDMTLARRISSESVDEREMFVYAFDQEPQRIIIEDSNAEKLFSRKKIELEIR